MDRLQAGRSGNGTYFYNVVLSTMCCPLCVCCRRLVRICILSIHVCLIVVSWLPFPVCLLCFPFWFSCCVAIAMLYVCTIITCVHPVHWRLAAHLPQDVVRQAGGHHWHGRLVAPGRFAFLIESAQKKQYFYLDFGESIIFQSVRNISKYWKNPTVEFLALASKRTLWWRVPYSRLRLGI